MHGPVISLELDDELIAGIELRAAYYSVTPEEYLADLILHGLATHQPLVIPEMQCPSLVEFTHALNGLNAEAKRWSNGKSTRRLHAARAIMLRLAFATGIYEYPQSAYTQENHP